MNHSTRRLTALLAGLVLAFAFGCERPTAPNRTEDATSGATPMNADQLPYAPRGAAAAAAKARAAAEAPAPTAGLTGAALGQKLYTSLACVTCHTLDGSRGLAPTFKGVYGSTVALADGTQVTVDDAYIKESILHPQAQLVLGYPPVMPDLSARVTPEDLDALCAYLKTLK